MEGVQERVPQLPLEEAQLIIMEVLYKGKRPIGAGNRYTRKIIEELRNHNHSAVIAFMPRAVSARAHFIECKRSKITVMYEVYSDCVVIQLYEVVPASEESPFSYVKLLGKETLYLTIPDLEAGVSQEFKRLIGFLINWLTRVTPYTGGLVNKIRVYARPGEDSGILGGMIIGVKSDDHTSNILLEGGNSVTVPVMRDARVGQYLLHTPKGSKVITQSEFLDNYTLV